MKRWAQAAAVAILAGGSVTKGQTAASAANVAPVKVPFKVWSLAPGELQTMLQQLPSDPACVQGFSKRGDRCVYIVQFAHSVPALRCKRKPADADGIQVIVCGYRPDGKPDTQDGN